MAVYLGDARRAGRTGEECHAMQGSGPDEHNAITQRAQQMAAEISGLTQGLTHAQADGLGGAGLVRATVGATGRVLDLNIDPGLFDPDDLEGLGRAAAEAVNSALDDLAGQRADQVGRVTGGISELLDTLRARSQSRQPD